MGGLEDGLRDGSRYRCTACGNVTRFDVVRLARTRSFHHFDLGGEREVEDEQVLDQQVESVTCRWCNRDDAIAVEGAPASLESASE